MVNNQQMWVKKVVHIIKEQCSSSEFLGDLHSHDMEKRDAEMRLKLLQRWEPSFLSFDFGVANAWLTSRKWLFVHF